MPREFESRSFTPAKFAGAYQFPTNLPGGGTIAIIEVGGNYHVADMLEFCNACDVPMPVVFEIEADRRADPGPEHDGEVALNTQLAAGLYSVMTGKPANLRIYWCRDLAVAVERILNDKAHGAPIVAASLSWGAPESGWEKADCLRLDNLFATLQIAGITLFVAAGDSKSPGAEVMFPASSPHVVACGGTTRGQDGSEKVWNSQGATTCGGFSRYFGPQPWQVGVKDATGRMVPDVSANADPGTGYNVFRGGWRIIGGTSAVAPLMAGMVAAFNPPPPVNVLLNFWAHPSAFTAILEGHNGAHMASAQPNPCTGLGVPYGVLLSRMFPRQEEIPPGAVIIGTGTDRKEWKIRLTGPDGQVIEGVIHEA